MEFYGLIAIATLLGITLCVVWIYLRKLRREKSALENRFREMELKLNSVEMETIRYKLNPHLFKNTLNSIQSHAYQTYHALDKLANVLDYILYESDQQFVSLKEELDFAQSLIEINRLKLSPLFDLRVKIQADESHPLYHQKLVAPLITVNLIENAFKHADLQSQDAFISILFELTDKEFRLVVTNKISATPALKKERGGFGKQHFKKRLELVYPNCYRFEQFTREEVYTVHLKLNLLEHKDQMLAAGR